MHPDTAPAGRAATATHAFARLANLWAAHRDGTTMVTPAAPTASGRWRTRVTSPTCTPSTAARPC
ncbi:hypothetical protein ACFQZ4_05705 [Catellatospora coxensis]